MLFDIHTSVGTFSDSWLKSKALPMAKRVYDNVASGFWGEHCIECGAPACYDTCEKYECAPNSLCRRFIAGIRKARLPKGRMGYAVHFKAWGKLELEFDGSMVGQRKARLLERINRICCGPIPRLGKKIINHYKSVMYKIVNRFLVKPGVPRQWIIECVANENTELIASIFKKYEGEIFVNRLKIVSGYNRWIFKVPDVGELCYFRLSSLNGTQFPIVFTELEVADVCPKCTDTAILTQRTDAKNSAEFVKCVVWDLDNTLWRGILVEDGAEGVMLRTDVVAVIKELDRRGIVSSICSKNDFAPAMKKLEDIGLAEYFVFPKINWFRKSENIKAIAKDMNIGLDAIAFVDDSSHERGEVSEALPMVRVYCEKAVDLMLGEHCFNPPVSSESAKRRLSYMAEMSRRKDEAGSTVDHESFIRSCEIKLELISVVDPTVRRRCWELVNRTNQLTLAGRRYKEEDFSNLILGGEIKSFAIRCHDKYGDYGIVGFVAIKDSEVIEFVMSCRVAKKYCEQSVLLALAKVVKKAGFMRLTALICPTGRNNALIEAFKAMPFVEISSCDIRLQVNIDLRCDFDNVFSNEVCFRDDYE